MCPGSRNAPGAPRSYLLGPARTPGSRGFSCGCGTLPGCDGHVATTSAKWAWYARNRLDCDISFMPEDAWDLDGLAREHGVTAVVDFGVAPGMSNVLAATGAK